MESFKLADKLSLEHTKAFIALKTALVLELVLQSPVWDGTHFILTTDGCKEGFAAVLAQQVKVVRPSGETV
ncbi:hypothetical protein GYMLUDRAFT_131670, partial [Collybiopsis luxurians FD-317 M1]